MSQNGSSINYRIGSVYSVATAFLYATQEPFSFPAARHLNTLQFVALTQVSLLVSLPLLLSRAKSRRDFAALLRKPVNYGYLGVIFAIGLTGLLLYNFGLSNAHPIIISAILNLSPFWAALVALVLAGVPIPISRATFFGCFAGAFIGAMAVAWSQLGDTGASNISQLTDSFLHGSWLYAIPVPLASALGGTLVGKWFGAYDESAAIAANFLAANVILIPGCLALLVWRQELNFNELGPILLMIFGTIVARPRDVSDRLDRHGRRQRLCHNVPQSGPGAHRPHIARAVALDSRPALCHRSHVFSRFRADRGVAGAVLAEIVAAARSTGVTEEVWRRRSRTDRAAPEAGNALLRPAQRLRAARSGAGREASRLPRSAGPNG
jgi:drug/metabolite transporter (DMT)-like permease